MKHLILLLSLCFASLCIAQQSYTIKNETLELNTEVDGTLDLLWNSFDG